MNAQPIYIIAEAGVNHNGSVLLAKKMIACASACGADAVKFQTFSADSLVSVNAPKAGYQLETTSVSETQKEMLKRLELSREDHQKLYDYARTLGIDFISTPFDLDSIDFLVDLGVTTIKVPSGEITNLPYLRKIGQSGKKIILSTGMSNLVEVGSALDVLNGAGISQNDLVLLHCTTQYPTPAEDVNLRAMIALAKTFGVACGYSDHTKGIEVAIAAAAMGACVIEKHFTLDKTMEGPDQAASLDPEELGQMVEAVRRIEKALGSDVKQATPLELENRKSIRKSIVAQKKIVKDSLFTEQNLTTKRPGTGISPMEWDRVIGQKAHRDFFPDEVIEL